MLLPSSHIPHPSQESADIKIDTSGILGAIFRFILFIRTDLIADITWDSVLTMTLTTAVPHRSLSPRFAPSPPQPHPPHPKHQFRQQESGYSKTTLLAREFDWGT